MVTKVKLTDVRPHLSELIGKVEFGGEKVIIERFGVPTAALVSMADLGRIWQEEADEIAGPVDPASGRRSGGLRLSGALKRGLAILRRDGKTLGDVSKDGPQER